MQRSAWLPLLAALSGCAGAPKVLIAHSKRKGDSDRARELEEKKKQAGAYAGPGALGILAALGASTPPEYDEKNALGAEAKADGKRNVASLVRLCLEPTFWKLPERGGKHAVDVDATLLDDGSIHVEVSGDVPSEIAECVRNMGPRVLAHAPASIKAHVDLSRARQSGLFGEAAAVLGGLQGGSIGEAFGAGGLGLVGRGGGGAGQGTIGLGSLGTRGVGGGTGRGYGSGRLKAKPKPSAQKPKLSQQKK